MKSYQICKKRWVESWVPSVREISCEQGSDLIEADKSTQNENSRALEVVVACDETSSGKQQGTLESKKHLSSQSVATQAPGEPFSHSQHGSTQVHANFSKN